MSNQPDALARALHPIVSRLRLDVTAVKNEKGQVYRSSEPLTNERLIRHLTGGAARGAYLIKPGRSTVQCAVLDLDDHRGETPWLDMVAAALLIIAACSARGLYVIPFRSSGGSGIHLWFIWDKPQDAYSVRMALRAALKDAGFEDGTGGVMKRQVEVFPKQNAVAEGRFGSQVWLPLARHSVPLNMCEFLGEPLALLPRESIIGLHWPTSAPVKELTAPKLDLTQTAPSTFDADHFRSMISFIGLDAGGDYSYSLWLETVGFGLHHASGGSEAGFTLWDEWSARGSNYAGTDECRYKWDTMGSDNVGENMVTAKSLEYVARRWGWAEDISGDFEDLSGVPAEDQTTLSRQVAINERATPPDVIRDGVENVLIFGDATDWYAITAKVKERLFMCGDHCTAVFAQGQWYLYADGFWRFADGIEIEKAVGDLMNTAWVIDKDSVKKRFKPATRHINEVVKGLERDCLKREVESPCWLDGRDNNAKDVLCLADGLLDVNSGVLVPHSPQFFTLNKLPYAWGSSNEAAPIPKWLNFLGGVWPDDQESIDCLQEMMGYFMTADTSMQKMFLLYGPTRSGKGTITRIINALLGAENIASSSIASLAGRFGLEPLLNKLVTVFPDSRNISARGTNTQVAVERMLSISGEDVVQVERKRIGSWMGRLQTRLLLLANELPSPGDSSEAFTGRFIILRMYVSFFGREDRGLENKLLGELPGILRWALEGRARLMARGYFIQPSGGIDAVDSMMDANNPVRGFVKWFIEGYKNETRDLLLGEISGADVDVLAGGGADGGWTLDAVPLDLFYSKYVRWCEGEGFYRCERKAVFIKALESSFEGRLHVAYRRKGGRDAGRVKLVEGLEGVTISYGLGSRQVN